MGQRYLSLKGQSFTWRGKSTQGINDRGERRWIKLENCYVHGDGTEIRTFPGWFKLVDLREGYNDNGFARYTNDLLLPIFNDTPAAAYQFGYAGGSAYELTLSSRAKPVFFHCFEQVGNQLIIIGESRFRENPIKDASNTKLTVVSVAKSGGRWLLTLSGTIAASINVDSSTPGFNGLQDGNIVYLEGITVSSSADQSVIDTYLNEKIHPVSATSGTTVTLETTGGSVTGTVSCSAGEIHTVRPNVSNSYNTPNGLDPYTSTYADRPDDPDALTAWRVTAPLDPYVDQTPECYPAWVANRQRDYGDLSLSAVEGYSLWRKSGGTIVSSSDRNVSRREQRKLPYRVNPECAEDRIVLAAPGYGCMFQVPLMVPTNPENWPNTPTTENYGIPFYSNSLFDKPRCLGVPKARMVEPNADLGSPSFMLSTAAASPEFGFPAGDYQISIAYEDEITGEEGLASDPITVTVPDGGTTSSYTICVSYVHPGYVMSECLAMKVNVYIATPNDDALAYYGSFPLKDYTGNQYQDRSDYMSAVYGFQNAMSPQSSGNIWHWFPLPLIGAATDPTDSLNGRRLAPQSASMPRGSDACRMIRGVLLSGGSLGNTGPSLELWKAKASSIYSTAYGWTDYNAFQIRLFGSDLRKEGDGARSDSTLGIAGRCFPDAYQGVEVFSRSLFPVGKQSARIDYVTNRQSVDYADTSIDARASTAWIERVILTTDVWGRTRVNGSPAEVPDATLTGQDIYYVMPKGQLQIHDPGEPGRASKAAIQFIDANKGDDITAIGHLSGNAIICTRRETYSYAWRINTSGETPNLLSTEMGCIAANSMIEFDGGLAWLSERGPVAIGAGLQFIGAELTGDFYGSMRRYQTDSRGMMRHSWGCHDASRGIIMWGLVSSDVTTTMVDEGIEYSWDEASDELKSRWPCDEVLIWNYRADAFSTWRPAEGFEIVWMRPLRDNTGQMRTCFMTKDGCIYALDDYAGEAIAGGCTTVNWNSSYTGVGTVAIGNAFEVNDLVEQIDSTGKLIDEAMVTAVDDSGVPTLSKSFTYVKNSKLVKDRRPRAHMISTYSGGSTMDNLNVQGVHARYSLVGNTDVGFSLPATATSVSYHAQVNTTLHVSDLTYREVKVNPDSEWVDLGGPVLDGDAINPLYIAPVYIARRRCIKQGGADAPEIAIELEVAGSAQVRFVDIGLEVGG